MNCEIALAGWTNRTGLINRRCHELTLCDCADGLSGDSVPENDRSVPGSGKRVLAVRTKPERFDLAFVPHEVSNLLPSPDVPQRHRVVTVAGSGQHVIAVRTD